MKGTRIFIESVNRMCEMGTIVSGYLSEGSSVSVGQYLDLFDMHGELILSTKVLSLAIAGKSVETALSARVSLKLEDVLDSDIATGSVLVGMSTSSELFMFHEENLGQAVGY